MRNVAFLLLCVTGCSGSNNGMLIDPGPAPDNGMLLVLPVVKDVKSGSSYEYCTWTDKILDHDIDIKRSKSIQSLSGHHAVLFYTTQYQDPGTTRVCTDDDMATFRFAGASGENEETVAPGDLVWRIPAGAQLVVNHHYLNATTHDLDAQSAMRLDFADANSKKVLSGSLAFTDTSLKIPSGGASLDINCTMTRDTKVWDFFPHMHKWGKYVTIDHVKNGVSERVFDVVWQEDYTFHAPQLIADLSSPYLLSKGDKVKVHCEWMNDSGGALTFGLEMCVAFAQTIDDDGVGNLACDKGQWVDF